MATVVPEVSADYQEVLSDASETNWIVLGYQDKNTIVTQGKGSGGLEELKQQLDNGQCQYAYLRVVSGDNESKRAKFVFISWVGENASALTKGKVSVHKASVKKVIQNIGCEFSFSELDEVTEEEIMKKVKKAMGADYSGNSN